MKKGFTLVELLAVIVILAIILAIAIPAITGIISNTTINSMEADAKMLLKAIEYKLLEIEGYDPTIIDETNILSELNVSAENYESLIITMVEGQPYIEIIGKNKWAGLTVCGFFNQIEIGADVECSNIELVWPDENGYVYNQGFYENMWIEGYCDPSGETIKHENYFEIIDTTLNDNECSLVSEEKIDFTDINSIKLWGRTGVFPPTSSDEKTFNVSSLIGEYYIRLHYVGNMFGMGTGYIVISSIQDGNVDVYDARYTIDSGGGALFIDRIWFE